MMQPYFERDGVVLHLGDCLDVLRSLPENSVDACVTDPPYDLTAVSRNGSRRTNNPDNPYGRHKLQGFMGKEWDGTGIAFRPDVWEEVLRALKPGGYLLAFGGTRTYHRMACAIEDAGFVIKDSIHWMYGSGFPKSLDIGKALDKAAGAEREMVGQVDRRSRYDGGNRTSDTTTDGEDYRSIKGSAVVSLTAPATDLARQWDGWGTALKPGHEPIVVAQKPLQGTYAANIARWGVGGLNVDGCRVALNGEAPPTGSGDRRGGAIYAQDEWTRTQMANGGNETSALGRWPANVVLDEDAAAELDLQAGILTSGTGAVKRKTGAGYRPNALGEESRAVGTPNIEYGDSGGASRFFYTAKASKSDRGKGNTHPTVKPVSLMRWLVRLVTPAGGLVLDPFLGSGTTALAAVVEGARFVGIDREAEYLEIAARRLATLPVQSLFAAGG